MFTGLIEEIGQISRIERHGAAARFHISAPQMAGSLALGESVAINGACLTVENHIASGFVALASEETLSRTNLRNAQSGRRVNLERALRLGDRLGGHLVAGHVDATGEFIALEPRDESWWLRVRAPENILSLSVPKGSIAIDGISLTLVDVGTTDFTVAVIPQTYQNTTLPDRRPGDKLNLEADMIGKYVAKAMGVFAVSQNSTERQNQRMLDVLKKSGFVV